MICVAFLVARPSCAANGVSVQTRRNPHWASASQKGRTTVITPFAYSINDAAKSLGIGRTKLYELIAQSEIAIVKIGSRTVVPHDQLASYFERQRSAA